jgi:general secretion pathway protein D
MTSLKHRVDPGTALWQLPSLMLAGLCLSICVSKHVQAQSRSVELQPALNRLEVSLPAGAMQPTLNILVETFAPQVQPTRLADGRIQFGFGAEQAILEFRPQQNLLKLEGTADLVDKLARICRYSSEQFSGSPLRVVPLGRQGQASFVQSSVFRQAAGTSANVQGAVPGNGNPTINRNGGAQLPQFQGFVNVRLAAQQLDSSKPANSVADDPAASNLRGLPLQQFDGVQIEMLPEIDAIILRGRDQQLNDLAEIIKQLDEASRQAKPEIEVLLLQHSSSDSIVTLIEAIQKTTLANRQGKVTAKALDKPNAVLLMGWGEALTVVKELIGKLDLPVPSNSGFDVIEIKHAIAGDLQKQLQDFYQKRGTSSPTVQVTVDARLNALIVHAAPRDLAEVRQIVARLDVARGEAAQKVRVFEIRHSLATDIADKLEKAIGLGSPSAAANTLNLPLELTDQDGNMIASSGSLRASRITVNDRNNTLIIASAPENLQLIEQLIQQLDTPGAVAKIKIFPIRYGDAAALVETLRSLIPSQSATTTNVQPQLSSSPNEESILPLRFTVDSRGNNIIAVGSEGDLKIVEALIMRLDESDKMQRKSSVYQLKNAPAVDIALAINEFLRNKRQVESVTPGSNNPFEQLEKEVVVVPEPVQNKLILSATPRYFDEISKLIEQLDQQPPQVMIQVLIAEIDLGNTHEFGMELGLQSSVLFDRSLLGNLLTRTSTTTTSTPAGVVTNTTQDIVAASNSPGFDFNNQPLGNSGSAKALTSSGVVGGQGLSNFSVSRSNEDLGFGGLVLSASSENVSFLLRALQDSRRLEILSRPQVLTLDNQKAFIQVGQRIPRIAAANVTQFGFQTSVMLENVGLIIGVTPRISPEGVVVMEIDAEKSELGNINEGIPISVTQDGSVIRSPILNTITAQATVSAADGETIILGGLISRSTRTNTRKVPWLGDIPVVKNFFRYEFNQVRRTELLIIMTPHVVRSPGDMERLKLAEFSRMSWCEADVFDIHGDVHTLSTSMEQSLDSAPWQTIYPDDDPRGKPLPPVNEAQPLTPAPTETVPANLYQTSTLQPGPVLSSTTVNNRADYPTSSLATVVPPTTTVVVPASAESVSYRRSELPPPVIRRDAVAPTRLLGSSGGSR